MHQLIIRSRRPGNHCQSGGISMVKCRCTSRRPVGNRLVWILLFVGRSINHACRMRIWRLLNCRPVNINRVMNVVHRNISGPVNIGNIIYPHILMCCLPYFLRAWSGYIGLIVVNVRIINNCSIVYNSHRPGRLGIIAINVRAVDVRLRRANPIVIRHMVPAANRYADADPGEQWRPAVISAAMPPAYPSRSPFVPGYPFPAVIIVIAPPAIVKSGPSPGIIRYPGISIFS